MADVKAARGVRRMPANPARFPTRSASMLMLAAFGGLALWLFTPLGDLAPSRGAGAQLPPSLRVAGPVQVESHDNVVTRLVVPLEVRGDVGIALTDESGAIRAETELSATAAAAVPATYTLAWQDGNGDNVLDPGETALLTVDLPVHSSVHPGNPLRLVLHTPNGGSLAIEDVVGTTTQ
jgi:hypothetical protein